MSHQADREFFEHKRSWSIRKDRILGAYLTAYLPKINTQGRPILLVDGFAGAGRFSDGTAGSPLIMHGAVTRAAPSSGASILAIESDTELFGRLEKLFQGNSIVSARPGRFLAHIDEIKILAQNHSLFLYLDPYAVRGLELAKLGPLFELLRQGRSVEVLINFNAPIFVRWALAALQRPTPADYIEEQSPDTPELAELDRIVGGDWWRDAIIRHASFDAQVREVVGGYCAQLRKQFQEVCFHEVYHRTRHTVPKYVLVFASRHPEALELMNDRMVKSDRQLAEDEAAGQISLFDASSLAVQSGSEQIRSFLRPNAAEPIARGLLIQQVIRQAFGQYLRREIRGEIECCLKDGVMASRTGKTRINDAVPVWWTGRTG